MAYSDKVTNNIQFITGEENRRKWHFDQPMEVVQSIIGD